MLRYVSLISWTDQGVRANADTLKRHEAGRVIGERMGEKVTEIYWTMGPYDIVAITEHPDDETAYAALLADTAGGNYRATMMRAFDRTEMAAVLAKVPKG